MTEMRKPDRRPHVRREWNQRDYVALIPGSENGLDYEFASPEEPMSLHELCVVLSVRFEEAGVGIYREGNTFFLADRDRGLIYEQWTAVHRANLSFWEEVFSNEAE